MPIIHLKKDRKWMPRTGTGWERCGLYNDIEDRERGLRKIPGCRSYTTLNRSGKGGKLERFTVQFDWEIYVLEGTLTVGRMNLKSGDHVIIKSGEDFSCKTKDGCTLLAVGHDIPLKKKGNK